MMNALSRFLRVLFHGPRDLSRQDNSVDMQLAWHRQEVETAISRHEATAQNLTQTVRSALKFIERPAGNP